MVRNFNFDSAHFSQTLKLRVKISILQCTLLSWAKLINKSLILLCTMLLWGKMMKKVSTLKCKMLFWGKLMMNRNFNFTVHTSLKHWNDEKKFQFYSAHCSHWLKWQLKISFLQCTLLSWAKMTNRNLNFAVNTALMG